MAMRLTLLGTQGWIPTGRRETTCLAFEDGSSLLLFDAGTGLRRLLEPPGSTMLAAARDVHLFLSHYHLDHVCGLAYLPGIFAGRRLTVHVPEAAVNGVDVEHGLATLIGRPFNPGRWGEQRGMELVTQTLREGVNEVVGHEVRMRRQKHADPTVGYRVDDAFAFITDTVADPATARFAAGVELLLHEAWIDGVEESDPAKADLVRTAYAAHTSARQAAALAAQAGAGELYLIHLNPLFDEGYYAQMEQSARALFGGAAVRPDLYARDLAV
jgi:ribonuclease BN (tRNA processing enzyme)